MSFTCIRLKSDPDQDGVRSSTSPEEESKDRCRSAVMNLMLGWWLHVALNLLGVITIFIPYVFVECSDFLPFAFLAVANNPPSLRLYRSIKQMIVRIIAEVQAQTAEPNDKKMQAPVFVPSSTHP